MIIFYVENRDAVVVWVCNKKSCSICCQRQWLRRCGSRKAQYRRRVAPYGSDRHKHDYSEGPEQTMRPFRRETKQWVHFDDRRRWTARLGLRRERAEQDGTLLKQG